MSSEEIKKKIRDYIKEIHGLKSVESDIKWTIEREVKMISRMNEQDQLLDELKWSKEEVKNRVY
jgi:metal-sulfur cluster biosynthetic enzyme